MVRKPPPTAKTVSEPKAQPLAEGAAESPLDYMLRIMRDPTCDAKRRDSFALKALPYCHKLLDGGKNGKDAKDTNDNQGPQGPTIRKFGEAVPSQSNNSDGQSQGPRDDGAR
jgi:hypothetical protein